MKSFEEYRSLAKKLPEKKSNDKYFMMGYQEALSIMSENIREKRLKERAVAKFTL